MDKDQTPAKAYRQALAAAFHSTLPVLAGFLVLGMAYGVLMNFKGYGGPWAVLFSLLVVYCLRGLRFESAAGWLPESLAVALVVLLHYRKENTLLSIGAGTVFYMILIRYIFV